MDGGGGAARHVGPPRSLDVQQFAAARSGEVQALYNALKAQREEKSEVPAGQSSLWSLTTPRHLRRRTASHNRRLPFRWRRSAGQTGKNEKKTTTTTTEVQSNGAIPASEEEPSRKRKKPEKRIPSRRVRRRIELQKVRDGTATCMLDGTRRLATHVWHAKRFPMTKTWGYCLPQGLPGRGRGSKAVFKWVKEAAVLHDASYSGLIELQGMEDDILRVLCQTLEPPPGRRESGLRVKEEEMHGLLYGNAVLHHVGKAPLEAIAPVTTLWRPTISEVRGTAEGGPRVDRQLWILVPPSAFDSALLALSTACERQTMDDREASVKCRSRRDELARLDILGSRALQVLQKVLRPVPRKVDHLSSTELAQVSGDQDIIEKATPTLSSDGSQALLSARIFAQADCLPGAAVLALDVNDPRDTPRSFYSAEFSERAPSEVIDKNPPGDDTLSTRDHLVEQETVAQDQKPPLDLMKDTRLTHWENLVENGLCMEVSDSPSLWSPQADRKVAALSQKAFSDKRHKSRKAHFIDGHEEFLYSSFKAGAVDGRVDQSVACPVLLLKLAHSRPSGSGWSVIMPMTWVHAFWVPVVFAGAHVIGLRERHWLATDAGIPYFPHDFPDCMAHAQHLEVEIAAFNTSNQARPPSKRRPSFAVSPLQRSVLDAYRDCQLDGSGRPGAVASELIDEVHGEEMMEKVCIIAGYTDGVTDGDGDSVMTEPGSSLARALSPLEDCSNPKTPVAGNLANEGELLPGIVSSIRVLPYGVDEVFLPDYANSGRDTAVIGTSVTATGSLVSPVACIPVDGVVVHESTSPLDFVSANQRSCLSGMASSLPTQSVDEAITLDAVDLSGDPTVTGIGTLVSNSPTASAPSQATDGVSVPELTKQLGDTNAVSDVKSLPDGVSPLSVASHGVDGAVIPQFTQLGRDGDSEIDGFDTEVPQLPSSEMSSETTKGVCVQLAPTPLDNDATALGVKSSVVASKLEQSVFDFHDGNEDDFGRCSVGDKVLPAEEMITPINLHDVQVPDIAGDVIDSHSFDQSSIPRPNSPRDHSFLGTNSDLKSALEMATCPVFVVRTMDTLLQLFRVNAQQQAFLFCSGLTNNGGVRNGLRTGSLEWRPSHIKPVESAGCTDDNSKMNVGVEGNLKSSVRLLIVIPRKGVLNENGVLCAPTKDDFESFLSRSQHWQGLETAWLNLQAKESRKKKGKGKEKGKGKKKRGVSKPLILQSNTGPEDFSKGSMPLDPGCNECCTRETIGCITSTGPQGSSWSGIGICDVGSLMKLRAMQWQDQRWWNKKEILLLAGSKLSPILRPVLVSIVLETGLEQDILWS